MRYLIVIERGKRNYSAYVPDVPGCVATARSLDGIMKDMREALAFHFEGMALHGETIPQPTESAFTQVASEMAPTDLIAFVELQPPVRVQEAV